MTKTCLIVDDSAVVRKICRKMMEGFGMQVLEATDGEDALAKCAASVPDIILLDWNMPVMDGMEFLKAFRPQQVAHGTIIIFCTTENDVTKIMTAIEAGANEYIMKPFDEEIMKTKFIQMGIIAGE